MTLFHLLLQSLTGESYLAPLSMSFGGYHYNNREVPGLYQSQRRSQVLGFHDFGQPEKRHVTTRFGMGVGLNLPLDDPEDGTKEQTKP